MRGGIDIIRIVVMCGMVGMNRTCGWCAFLKGWAPSSSTGRRSQKFKKKTRAVGKKSKSQEVGSALWAIAGQVN